jgi:hypothetical protein
MHRFYLLDGILAHVRALKFSERANVEIENRLQITSTVVLEEIAATSQEWFSELSLRSLISQGLVRP